jgi:hypothetical protein
MKRDRDESYENRPESIWERTGLYQHPQLPQQVQMRPTWGTSAPRASQPQQRVNHSWGVPVAQAMKMPTPPEGVRIVHGADWGLPRHIVNKPHFEKMTRFFYGPDGDTEMMSTMDTTSSSAGTASVTPNESLDTPDEAR